MNLEEIKEIFDNATDINADGEKTEVLYAEKVIKEEKYYLDYNSITGDCTFGTLDEDLFTGKIETKDQLKEIVDKYGN